MTAKTFNFEKAMTELEAIVEKMEDEELSLEQSLKNFEKGIQLTQQCQKALQEAEQKVRILIEKNGKTELADFSDSSDDDE
ncbi:MAG: exodeoxyribonuclease VII small subunit [Gammaproteobacteria bacterium]|nr:exodeoxyribonuclease VII small subunit [Gammaproteobacteria bacterium]